MSFVFWDMIFVFANILVYQFSYVHFDSNILNHEFHNKVEVSIYRVLMANVGLGYGWSLGQKGPIIVTQLNQVNLFDHSDDMLHRWDLPTFYLQFHFGEMSCN